MMYYLLWLLIFPLHALVVLACWWTNPLACLFVYRVKRTDKVKRLDKRVVSMDREYLKGIWYLWQTHDNACDEYWYGMYNESSWYRFVREATQAEYDKSAWLRYVCRVFWLTRNTAYGWTYKLFSVSPNKGFQVNKEIPIGFGYVNHINIGWKSHDGITRKLYAGRIFKLKKATT